MPGLNTARESNAFLAQLTGQQLAALQGRDVMLRHGTRLHDAGCALEFVYFPRSCVISMSIVMDDGRSAGTAVVGREGVAGLFADFSPERAPSSAATRADVLIGGAAVRVPMARFLALLQTTAFAALVSRHQRALLDEADRNTACSMLHSLDERASRFLLTVDQRGMGQTIPATQETLALILGAHRASLNKSLQKMLAAGATAPLRRGLIEIRDRAVLQSLSCRCFAAAGRPEAVTPPREAGHSPHHYVTVVTSEASGRWRTASR